MVHWLYFMRRLERKILILLSLELCEKCLYSEFFWSTLSRIWNEYGEMLRISPYSVWMLENANHKKLKMQTLFTQCSPLYLERCQASKAELFSEIANGSTIFTKSSAVNLNRVLSTPLMRMSTIVDHGQCILPSFSNNCSIQMFSATCWYLALRAGFLLGYTNADSKISLYVSPYMFHMRIIPWKFRILHSTNSRVIYP